MIDVRDPIVLLSVAATSLTAVAGQLGSHAVLGVAGVCWLLAGHQALSRAGRSIGRLRASLFLSLIVATLLSFALPRSIVYPVLRPFNAMLESTTVPFSIGKLLHVVVFAVVVLCLCIVKRRGVISLCVAILTLVFAAIVSESIQEFTSDRTSSLRDVGIDLAGAGLGLLAYLASRFASTLLRSADKFRRGRP